jgi:hypothetical protein
MFNYHFGFLLDFADRYLHFGIVDHRNLSRSYLPLHCTVVAHLHHCNIDLVGFSFDLP